MEVNKVNFFMFDFCFWWNLSSQTIGSSKMDRLA